MTSTKSFQKRISLTFKNLNIGRLIILWRVENNVESTAGHVETKQYTKQTKKK